MGTFPEKIVSPIELRKMFEDERIIARELAGELTFHIKHSRIPNPPPDFEPPGTESQEVYWRDRTGEKIATAHRYLRPDKTIGASGKEDPKVLLIDGVIYKAVTFFVTEKPKAKPPPKKNGRRGPPRSN